MAERSIMAESNPVPAEPKPFPAVTGSCGCAAVQYRLLTSPLFCYACHCSDCQKSTGSAFSLSLNIECFNIRILSSTRPVATPRLSKGNIQQYFVCPKCGTELWSNNLWGEGICDVRVGTLDFPSLMEPDIHSFVDSKLDWIVLPEGARTVKQDFGKEIWPKSSLRRLEICRLRVAEARKQLELKSRSEEESGGRRGGWGGCRS